jgi:integrase
MELTIFPKPPGKTGLSRLYFVLYIAGKQVWIPTGVKCLHKAWDQEHQLVTSKQPKAGDLNKILTKRKSEINDISVQFQYGNKPLTAIALRHELEKIGKKQDPVIKAGTDSVADYFDLFMSRNKSLRSAGYLRNFKQVKTALTDFYPGIKFKDLTSKVLNEWLQYLIEDDEKEDESGLENATVVKHISRLRVVIRMAEIDGLQVPKDYHMLKLPKISYRPFWLSDESLTKLLEFEPIEERQIYKDEFLFRVYTGLRHSDSFNLKPENIIKQGKDYYIDFTTIKTRLDQNLLLSSSAVQILKKWNFKPPRLHQHDCNFIIKEIARAAKLNKMVEKVRYSGSERLVSMLPESAMVTTHTARRTFARIWMDKGGSLSKLSRYLGHSSEKQTSEYIGYTAKEVNDELRRLMG